MVISPSYQSRPHMKHISHCSSCSLIQRSFQSIWPPTTIFIIGLAGRISHRYCDGATFRQFFFSKSSVILSKKIEENIRILKAAVIVSSITMNLSFLTILFLSWIDSYFVSSLPWRFINGRKVVTCVCETWIYSLLFLTLLLIGIP